MVTQKGEEKRSPTICFTLKNNQPIDKKEEKQTTTRMLNTAAAIHSFDNRKTPVIHCFGTLLSILYLAVALPLGVGARNPNYIYVGNL